MLLGQRSSERSIDPKSQRDSDASCVGAAWGRSVLSWSGSRGFDLALFVYDVSQELFHCFQVGVQAIAKARVGGDNNLHFVTENGCWVDLDVLCCRLHKTLPDTSAQTLLSCFVREGFRDADGDSQKQKHFDDAGHCWFLCGEDDRS